MYLDADAVIRAAQLVGAFGCLTGLAASFFRLLERDRQQTEMIRAIQEEQKIICWGLKGALQGLIESGCNGPCKEALQKLEKHLNEQAHDPSRT